MAPFTILTTLASILALSTSVTAQSGTGTGLPIASATLGAPYPLSNGTLPYGSTGTRTGISIPTGPIPSSVLPSILPGTSGLPGASCPVPSTVTATTSVTVTVTVTASSAAAPTIPASVPYPIPGSSGVPIGTGTGTGSGYAVATGYAKRMEMRGLTQERRERKRGSRFW
ncbi:hypothetical protein IMSHALPRED_010061 [Imshaugia aleurites]|uniref:Uncharacterized protein n=1 Tax=Imshaugia aleurites TaxID=172621 RepID=A0A8H3G553_9LECA|nr:hypothetical protein IMSHALPRED_010061 [Imshaugia aleurites]